MFKFKTGDLVIIQKINDKAQHLKNFEGKPVSIIGWVVKSGVVRYKVMLVEDNNEIFYCRENELA